MLNRERFFRRVYPTSLAAEIIVTYIYRILILVILNRVILTNGENKQELESDTKLNDAFQKLLMGYDKFIRPNYTGSQTVVNVSVTILDIRNVNARDMTFDVELLFRQTWYDYRLRHSFSKKITPLLGRRIPASYIWAPDICFQNAKKEIRIPVTTSNRKLDIYSDGRIFSGSRVTVTAFCEMDLKNFPMDIQTCRLTMESFAYPLKHLKLKWNDKSVVLITPPMLQFELVGIYNISNVTTSILKIGDDSANYSSLQIVFKFQRRISYAILQVYFPCIAVVFISWISPWFHVNCVSARIGLGITALLTLTKIWMSEQRRLPSVSYIKAIDIYFIVSFFFILGSMIEYVVVLNLTFNERKKKYDENKINKSARSSLDNSSMHGSLLVRNIYNLAEGYDSSSLRRSIKIPIPLHPFNTQKTSVEKPKQKINRDEMPYFFKYYPVTGKSASLDNIFRFMFPFCYFCFNVWYWSTYHKENETSILTNGDLHYH